MSTLDSGSMLDSVVVALAVQIGAATHLEAFVTAALEGLPVAPGRGGDSTRTAAELIRQCLAGDDTVVLAIGTTPAPPGVRTRQVAGVREAIDAAAAELEQAETVVLLGVDGGDGVAIAVARFADERPAFARISTTTGAPSELVLAVDEAPGTWPGWPAGALPEPVRNLALLAEAAVCLHRLVLPARPRAAAEDRADPVDELGYWPMPANASRRCSVRLRDAAGAVEVELTEATSTRRPARARLADRPAVLVPVAATSAGELADGLEAIAAEPADLRATARAAYERWRTSGDATVSAALVATTWEGLRSDIAFFIRQLHGPAVDREWRTPAGSVLTARPTRGEVAFVYPGFASAYAGAGRRLGYLFPQLQDSLLATFGAESSHYLHLDLLSPRFGELGDGTADIRALSEATTALAAVYTALAREVLSLGPRFAFGYSVGEAAMMFSLGVWRDVEQVSRQLDATGLLAHRLGGEMTTVRDYWAAKQRPVRADEPAWAALLVRAPVAELIVASGSEPGCFIPLINTPTEAVLAGHPDAVSRVAAQVAGRAVPLEPPLPLHCAPMRAEHGTFYDQYLMPAQAPGLALYSSAGYRPVPAESTALAAAIADSYTTPVDFPRLVRQVYADGARVFVEIGPRRICSTWIDEILGDRPHIAVPLDLQGVGEDVALLRGMAQLVAHRVPIDLEVAYESADGVLASAVTPALSPVEASKPAAPAIADLITAEVARALSCPAELIDQDASLLELGIDSLTLIGLADRAERDHGIRLDLADLVEAATIAGLARLIETRTLTTADAPRATPVADTERRHDPFPISDLQRAYLFGRDASVPLGGIGCQAYFEFDLAEVDPDRFAAAWREVVAEQDVLRLVIIDSRDQRVLPMPAETPLTIVDLRTASGERAEQVRASWRAELTERVHDPAAWPLWDLRLAVLPGGAGRLHAEFDLIATDAGALYGVLARLSATYARAGAPAAPLVRFRDIRAAVARDSGAEESAGRWWSERVRELPLPPQLPRRADLSALTPPSFIRCRTEIDASLVARLEKQAAAHRLSLAATLNAAFAEAVATHSTAPRFLLNLPVFLPPVRVAEGELPLGNYTSNILVAADLVDADFAARAGRLGREVVASLAHVAYSGARVLAELARHRGSGLEPGAPIVLTNLLEHRRDGRADALPGTLSYGVSRTPQVLLDHQIVPTPDGIAFHWDHVEGAFADDLVPTMARGHLDLVTRLADGDGWTEPAAYTAIAAPPRLPVRSAGGSGRRTEAMLDATEWAAIRDAARGLGVEETTALLAGCAETVSRWSESERFTLAGITGPRAQLCTVSIAAATTPLDRVAEWRAAFSTPPYLVDEAALVLRRFAEPPAAGEATSPVPVAIAVGEDCALAWPGVSCTITSSVDGLAISWHDATDRCADDVLSALAEGLVTTLRQLAAISCWSEPLDALPPTQAAVRDAVNATTRVIEPMLLHDGFVARAHAHPDALAVAAPQVRRSYGELQQRTDRLAAALRSHGVRNGDLVAIVLSEQHRLVEAALAVSKSGAAYVPIDTGWPTLRQRQVLERSGARFAIVAEPAAGWLAGVQRIDVDAVAEPAEWLPPAPGDLGYVIFTSGSTGEPKGVAIEHAAAANTIADMIDRFGIRADDRLFGISSFAFDLSVFDIFGTLAAGAALVVPHRTAKPDPGHWNELMAAHGVTVWNSVPALMGVLLAHLDDSTDTVRAPLRQCWLSGDWIPLSLPDRIRRRFPGTEVISLGGATEASIWSIYHRIEEVDSAWRSIPYGRPLANQRWHVLDDAGRPRPDLVPGDLHVAGAGLARGYWQDSERTRPAFATHPRLGERTYRTGDRGRYRPDGSIEFLGRRDTQVKVRGHRIELGEIEAVLGNHPAVRQAVAAVRTTPSGGDRLAAWVTLVAPDRSTPAELQQHLRDRLPDYMVAAVRVVEALPLTANGKLDRAALPDPFPAAALPAAEVANAEFVDELRALIGDTLRCAPPGLHDDLMELGASSLDVVSVVGEIERRYGTRPSYQDFFGEPTVATLARTIGAAGPRPEAPTAVALPPLIDPAERDAFKHAEHGIRAAEPGRASITLPGRGENATAARRRSTRQFRDAPVPLERLAGWLATLASTSPTSERKHAFGSAGGLYSVQTYLHASAVDGLAPGLYYHHPREHSLLPIAVGGRIGPEVHDPFVNRSVFTASSFSVFLISCPAACEPMYGELAGRFAQLEAGAMAQLLDVMAADYELGVCQIGWLDFAAIAPLFHLQPGQQLLHSLVGGLLEHVDDPAHEWLEGEL